MTHNIKLPDERGEQLKMIAEREGKTVVDVITDHIRAKIAEGVIPADLPHVEVTQTETSVAISAPGFDGSLPVDKAPLFTNVLREVGAKLTPADIERKQRLLEGLGALTGIKVERMARGVRLISASGQEYPIAFGVAADLADQIERSTK